ncbi:RDD family protein [Anaerobacillus sp. HL2]|nr:RDD family protein [Anaerobacillus sp. HL2]
MVQSKNNSQTFGKKITGIRVTGIDGDKVEHRKNVFKRNNWKNTFKYYFINWLFNGSWKKASIAPSYIAGTIVVRAE